MQIFRNAFQHVVDVLVAVVGAEDEGEHKKKEIDSITTLFLSILQKADAISAQ